MTINRRQIIRTGLATAIAAGSAIASGSALAAPVTAVPGQQPALPFPPGAGKRSRLIYLNDLGGDIDGLFATVRAILSPSKAAAMFATIGGLAFSILLKFLPGMLDLAFLAPIGFAVRDHAGAYEIPFLDRMFIVFCVAVAGMVVISRMSGGGQARSMEVDPALFRVDRAFATASALICAALAAIYAILW